MQHAKSIDKILDEQARLWELRERLAAKGGPGAREALVHLEQGPWITVSRQLGSGGTDLAHRLAAQLGWQVFDREVLTAIAQAAHTSERLLSHLDERAVSSFNDMIAHVVLPSLPSRSEFITSMTKIVWGLAHKGKAVILGRGANWYLDPRFGLRLRIVAPFNQRVQWLAAAEKLSEGDASEQLRRHDAEQVTFIRQVFGREIDDPCGYDLVLNLGTVEIDAATDTALAALRSKLIEQR